MDLASPNHSPEFEPADLTWEEVGTYNSIDFPTPATHVITVTRLADSTEVERYEVVVTAG